MRIESSFYNEQMTDMSSPTDLLRRSVELARRNVIEVGGRPFGAVLARDGEVLQEAVNESVQTGDPTAHAELMALRKESRVHGPEALKGATVYASGAPCPMCFAAMHLVGIREVFYAYSQEDGASHGLSTKDVYEELAMPEAERSIDIKHKPVRVDAEDAPPLYRLWEQKTGRA